MLILSRIIAKEWFKAMFGAVIVLFILITVGDIVNGFLRNYEASRVFMEYFLKLPELMGKALPISSLLASLFAINKLKSHSELMAILAAGYSAKKFYMLILVCSVSIATFQFINLGLLQPVANKIKRQEFEKSRKQESKYIARSKIGSGGLMWYKTDNYFTAFSAFDRKLNTLKDVSFYYFNENNNLTKVIKATSAKHVENKWILSNAKIFNRLHTLNFPSIGLEPTMELAISEEPSDFNQFESDITTLSFFSLAQFIRRLDKTGINTSEYKIMLFEKVSLSVICIIFALFPASGIFSPNRRSGSFGKNIIFTLLFSIFFWLIYSSLISQGINGNVPPVVATMSIPIIFTFYILWTFRKNRTL
jgi:lipopolysaccharide export system permease protein